MIATMPSVSGGRVATPQAITDPFFSSVSLLLHGEGANGGSTITDSSGSALTPTGNVDVTTDTSDFKFGASCLSQLSGSVVDDLYWYTNRAGLLLPGDFSIEGWHKVASRASLTWFVLRGQSADAAGRISFFTDSSGHLQINRFGQGTQQFGSSAAAFPLNTWFWLQFIRSGSTLTCAVDAATIGSVTDSASFSNNGGGMSFERCGAAIKRDDFRVTKGIARSIGVPTAQLPDS